MSFNKFIHLYYHHPLQKVDIEGLYLNIIKATYDKLIASIILNGEKFESISCRIRNKKRNFGSLSQSNQIRKRDKREPN